MPKVRHAPDGGDRLRLQYLHRGMATYLPGETLGPRVMHDYEMVWIMSGVCRYQSGGDEYDAPPGTLILARPGFHERYTWDAKRTTRHAYFHFDVYSTPSDWPAVEAWPVVRTMADGDMLRPIFRHIMDHPLAQRGEAPLRPTERNTEALLSAFIMEDTPREPRRAEAHAEPVRRALERLAHLLVNEPSASVTLADLAAAASVSPKHLCRLFARELHIGPMEALRLLRLEQAAVLLARSNLTVKQIAARYGFASPYHFSRIFSKAYGLPPTEIRRQALQGLPSPRSPLMIDLPRLEQW